MRTERFALSWLCAVGAALCFLTGCPGKLHDKQGFLLYAATHDATVHDATVHEDGGHTVPGNVPVDASLCGDVVTRIFVAQCGDALQRLLQACATSSSIAISASPRRPAAR